MRNSIFKYAIYGIFTFLAMVPTVLFAGLVLYPVDPGYSQSSYYTQSAYAAGADSGLVTCTDPQDCNLCTLIQMFDRVLDFLFKFLTLAAVMMVMYAGFQLVISQGNSGAMEKAKGMISNIVIGFVIMMSAWLIIDTVMKGLVDTEAGYGQWNELGEC